MGRHGCPLVESVTCSLPWAGRVISIKAPALHLIVIQESPALNIFTVLISWWDCSATVQSAQCLRKLLCETPGFKPLPWLNPQAEFNVQCGAGASILPYLFLSHLVYFILIFISFWKYTQTVDCLFFIVLDSWNWWITLSNESHDCTIEMISATKMSV